MCQTVMGEGSLFSMCVTVGALSMAKGIVQQIKAAAEALVGRALLQPPLIPAPHLFLILTSLATICCCVLTARWAPATEGLRSNWVINKNRVPTMSEEQECAVQLHAHV